MFYILTILVSVILISVGVFIGDGVFTLLAFGKIFGTTALGAVAAFAIDGIFAFVARRLPMKWFPPEAKLFMVSTRERKIYRRLKINSWKKYVPELGGFTGFHKDKMRDRSSSEYVGRFLTESHYGVLGHVLGALLGFLVMLLPFLRPLSMGLPIAIVNFILSMLPTMILRYNTPSLCKVYRMNLMREQRDKNGGAENAPKESP